MKNTPQLYAGANLLDLDGATVAVTLTANSYEQPDKVNSSYTNSFTIPWTRANQQALGALTADERTGKQYEVIPSLLSFPASIDVVGNLHIFESDNYKATGAFVAGIASLFDALGDSDLWCLSFGSTFANDTGGYVGERNNVYTDGFSTAYADFQEIAPTANTVNINRLFPFPFFWQVVQDVCAYAGWTCEVDELLADSFFRKVCFAYNGEKYKENEYFSAQAIGFALSAGAAPGNYLTIDGSQAGGIGMTPLIQFAGFDYFSGVLDLTGTCGKRILQLAIDSIDITTDAGSYHFQLRIYAPSLGATYASFDSGLVTGAGATVTLPALELITAWTDFGGVAVECQIKVDVGLNVALNLPTFRFADGRDGFTDLIWGHDVVYPYASLPKMKCTEFLKAVCKMFGAIPRIDLRSQTVAFVKFEDMATDFANSQNWTGKFDRLARPIEWRYGEYGRLNTAIYDNNDDVPKQFGSGTMTVTNQQLPATYEWLKVPFSGSITVPFVDGAVQMARVPVYDENDKLQKLNPRVVYLTNETAISVPFSPSITDGVTTTLTATYNVARFDLSSDLNSLSWGGLNGLIAVYHASFNRMLNRMHKLTAYFNLSAGDFAKLNFFAPVYINYSRGGLDLNGWYILQEVKEYDGRETVEVGLLKIDLPT